MIAKIIGIRPYEKEGLCSTVISISYPYEDYQVKKGCVGQEVLQEFCKGLVIDPSMVGSLVNIEYGKGFGGKAFVVDINPIKEDKR